MQNVTPFFFERRLKHGRGVCEKWLDDIILYRAAKLYKIPKGA